MMRLGHVVVVENSDEDFGTVCDAAKLAGVLQPIVRARTGAECMSLLRGGQGRGQGRPGSRDAHTLLVLLDLNMHGDDGRDVLLQVRRDDALGITPVVVLSASTDERDLRFCYANSANAYHVKPVDHVLHLRVLQDIFAYWLGSVVLPSLTPRYHL
jgi:CheY-like chemotaxis protein